MNKERQQQERNASVTPPIGNTAGGSSTAIDVGQRAITQGMSSVNDSSEGVGSQTSNHSMHWYDAYKAETEHEGRAAWPSSSSSSEDEDEDDDEALGSDRGDISGLMVAGAGEHATHMEIETEVLNPLDEHALNRIPTRLSSDMRSLQEQRLARWNDMVAAGLVPAIPAPPPTSPVTVPIYSSASEDELDDELDDEPLLSGQIFNTVPNTVSVRRSLSSASDPSVDSMAPVGERVLRVVNGSVRSTSSEDTKGKGRATEGVDIKGKGRATNVEDEGKAAYMTTPPGRYRDDGPPSSSAPTTESIVPMAHWNVEARRIGMPLSMYPTTPQGQMGSSSHVGHQEPAMGGVNVGLAPTTLGSPQPQAHLPLQGTPGSGSTSPPKKGRRPSIKELFRRPFIKSAHKKTSGSYLNRLFRRGTSSEANLEAPADQGSGAMRLIGESPTEDLTPPNLRLQQHNPSESVSLPLPSLSHGGGSGTASGSGSENERSHQRNSPKKQMTFRGQVEKYD